MAGKKKLLTPVLTTMNKYLFDHYRLPMYTYINRLLRNGKLSRIVGTQVLNKVMKKETLSFPHVSFWDIDRTSFYTDVQVQMKLETRNGMISWNGYLVLWCSFDGEFRCEFECLTDELNRKEDGFDPLDSYLVPCYTSKRVDAVAEEIWMKYIPEAITDPQKRNAFELAKRMKLAIQNCRIYEHRGVDTILFFEEDYLTIGEDRYQKDENGKKEHIKAAGSQPERIKGNTIVVNENTTRRGCSSFGIFHECYHYEKHYKFYLLQKMGSNDPRNVEMKEIIVDEGAEPNDPIYFMEKQANRGAYGLMLPASSTQADIMHIYSDVEQGRQFRHAGEHFEAIGQRMCDELLLPLFRIRARMIQFGYIQAKGAMNYDGRNPIQPFAFDIETWREEQHTFVIDKGTVEDLRRKNEQFRAVMSSGQFVHADGHVVRNDERFVRQGFDWQGNEKLLLTDWANAHVDECCLRFVRVYVQQNTGRYVFGRMYLDSDYIEQTKFYLDDLINQGHMDELDAKTLYIQTFPKSFKGAVEFLKRKNKANNYDVAAYLQMDDSTFARSLDDPRRYMNADFLTMLCLYFKLPDWISRLVFKRACFQLDEEVKRHQALLHILRVQSNDGLEAANAYLERNKLDPLKI